MNAAYIRALLRCPAETSPVEAGSFLADRGHSLTSLLPPPAALGSLPLALQNGIDVKTVSSMLGHSSAGFTLATYTHATNKVQEQAAAKMGSLLKQAL